MMKPGSSGRLVAFGMLLGGLPLSASIYLFLAMTAARAVGHPYGGDALGLMMMSLLAFAIAAISCLIGLLYFAISLAKSRSRPNVWQAIILGYSAAQIILPIFYFFSG